MSYICEACGKSVEDKDKFGSGRFCCRACANGHKHSEETKKKISDAINKKTECECKFCSKKFDTLTARASHERLCGSNPERLSCLGAQANHQKKLDRRYKTNMGALLDITYQDLLAYQETQKTCEICGKTVEEATKWANPSAPKHLCVDHDHKTNRFRGLLCSVCNRQLGWYEANQEAINKYLNK